MRLNLNYDWKYTEQWSEDLINPSYDDSDMQIVQIPHTNKELPYNYFDESMYQFVSGYRKTFDLPAEMVGKILVLKFEAVMSYAVVYVNGVEVTSHKGGYTAFEVDITDHVHQGTNTITVMCDSTEREDTPPFGNVIDYLTYGGIYREVYLYAYEQDYVKSVLLSPMAVLTNQPYLDAKITLNRLSELELLAEIMDGDQVIRHKLIKMKLPEDATQEPTFHLQLQVDLNEVQLWTLDNAKLYTFRVTYAGEQYCYRFGFREAKFTAKGFLLNGVPIKIRGLNRHQAYPYVGYAMPKSAQIADADYLKKDLGVNLVRTSHYPNSHHFLDRCDELGLLVFTEIPGWQHVSKEAEWRQNAINNVREMITEDFNHPSIILWGVRINESGDDHELYTETNRLAHELDKTRQTGGVRCIPQSELLEDVYTYNDFSHSGGKRALLPKLVVTKLSAPLLITEHNGHMFPTKAFDHEKKRQNHALRHANVLNEAYRKKGTSGAIGWCMSDYNTHKDFGSGDKICYHGVSDMFRMDKLAAFVYKSQQDSYPVVELTSNMEIGDNAGGMVGSVYMFTNCDKVNLYKNDVLIDTIDVKAQAKKSKWKYLPHPPIELYDIIGNQLETSGKFKARDCKGIKAFLLDIKKYSYVTAVALHLPSVFKLLVKYKQSIADITTLYGSYVTGWGAKACSYKLEGTLGGETVSVCKETIADTKLVVSAEKSTLVEDDTYDVCKISLRAMSTGGANLPYADEVVSVSTTGPITVIGDSTFTLPGGQRAFWVKSLGASGDASVTIDSKHGTQIINLSVQKL